MPSEQSQSDKGDSSIRVKNDELILSALAKLEDLSTRKKLKPTLKSLVKLSRLSTNTVRSRDWALTRIDDLKKVDRAKCAKPQQSSDQSGSVQSIPLEDVLQKRLNGLLQQNTVLFEEILSLRRQIKKRDEHIENLQGRRLQLL